MRGAVAAVGACVAVVSAPALVTTAHALTEARISRVTCTGFDVAQSGLPANTRMRIEALDPVKLRHLAHVVRDSGHGGAVAAHLRVSLKGLRRVDVTVERTSDHAEFGEVGVDLHLSCGAPLEAPQRGVSLPDPAPGHAADAAHPRAAFRQGTTHHTSPVRTTHHASPVRTTHLASPARTGIDASPAGAPATQQARVLTSTSPVPAAPRAGPRGNATAAVAGAATVAGVAILLVATVIRRRRRGA